MGVANRLSIATTIVAASPGWTASVISYWKPGAPPMGRAPMNWPFTQSAKLGMTPPNLRKSSLPAHLAGMVILVRCQATLWQFPLTMRGLG